MDALRSAPLRRSGSTLTSRDVLFQTRMSSEITVKIICAVRGAKPAALFHHTPALLAVDLRLEYADVRHIAVLLGVIQPVALPTAQARREPFDLTLNGTE